MDPDWTNGQNILPMKKKKWEKYFTDEDEEKDDDKKNINTIKWIILYHFLIILSVSIRP